MPRSPAKSLTSTAASPPDTSLDPPRDAEEVRLWRNGAWTPWPDLVLSRGHLSNGSMKDRPITGWESRDG